MRDQMMRFGFAATMLALGACPGFAGDIVADWGSVKPPAAPQLQTWTGDPRTPGLVVVDLMKNNCGARPRCAAMVPSVKRMIDAARAHNMMIAYNLTGPGRVEDMVDASLAPRAGDHMIKNGRGANKFY